MKLPIFSRNINIVSIIISAIATVVTIFAFLNPTQLQSIIPKIYNLTIFFENNDEKVSYDTNGAEMVPAQSSVGEKSDGTVAGFPSQPPRVDKDFENSLNLLRKSEGFERNRLIEIYARSNIMRFSWWYIKQLISIISFNDKYPYYDGDETRGRIVFTFLRERVRAIDLHTSIDIANCLNDGSMQNKAIELYFNCHKQALKPEEVGVLLESLSYSNSYKYYSGKATSDRINMAYLRTRK